MSEPDFETMYRWWYFDGGGSERPAECPTAIANAYAAAHPPEPPKPYDPWEDVGAVAMLTNSLDHTFCSFYRKQSRDKTDAVMKMLRENHA